MAAFSYAGTTVAVSDDIVDSHRSAWDHSANRAPGGPQTSGWPLPARARHRFAERANPPWMRSEPPSDDRLAIEVGPIVDLVTLDAARIDRRGRRRGADARVRGGEAGPGEVCRADRHRGRRGHGRHLRRGCRCRPRATPGRRAGRAERGAPRRARRHRGPTSRPSNPFPAANVARALSLVPDANTLFRTVVGAGLLGPWLRPPHLGHPAQPPQVELVASRVAAMNECFY